MRKIIYIIKETINNLSYDTFYETQISALTEAKKRHELYPEHYIEVSREIRDQIIIKTYGGSNNNG